MTLHQLMEEQKSGIQRLETLIAKQNKNFERQIVASNKLADALVEFIENLQKEVAQGKQEVEA